MQIIMIKNVSVQAAIATTPLKLPRYALTGLLFTINGIKHTVSPKSTDEAATKNQLPLVYIQITPRRMITLAVKLVMVRNILFLGAMSGTTKSDVGISIAARTMKNQLSACPLARFTIRQTRIGIAKIAAITVPISALFLLKKFDCD